MTLPPAGAPSYDDLAARLADAEAALGAVAAGAVDALAPGPGAGAEMISLERADSFFVTLVTEMQEATASLDSGGTLLYANPRFAELLGLSLSQVLGRTLAELTAKAGRTAARRLLAEAPRGPTRGTLELVRGDGRLVPVSVSAAPIASERPEICLVATDLTERKRAETTLREAEERFRSAFEQAPIGMALLSLDGRFERVNAELAAIVGRPEEQLLGTPLASLLDRPDATALLSRLTGLRTGEQDSSAVEVRYLGAAGRGVWVAESAAAIRGADGRAHQILLQVEDIAERRRYQQQLEHLASHDPLTGLQNRRAFERELAGHMDRGARYGAEGALVVLDLDNFKYVNDTLGHGSGDALLVAVANALGERLRGSDTVARLGGDEFAVLLPRADPETAQLVAGALVQTVREVDPPGPRPVTASAGIALFTGSAATADEMLVLADLAMYEAKERGGDVAHLYAAHAGEATMELGIGWLKRLEQTIAEGSLLLYAQPIFDLRSGQVDRHELLVRMPDGDGGVVSAATFIPLAERYGLVAEIDRWVLDRAVGLLESGVAPRGSRLAVNVSAKSLDADYVAWIECRLAASTIDAARLSFELTETAAISNLSTSRPFAQRLRDLGCELALDDFGAGFGSFTYLRHIPFDLLKIEGQFVRECARDARDRALVEALVKIAGSLGKRTVAEFVGDEPTVAALNTIGVDMAQGYHLGRPAPVEEALRCEPARSKPRGDAARRDTPASAPQ